MTKSINEVIRPLGILDQLYEDLEAVVVYSSLDIAKIRAYQNNIRNLIDVARAAEHMRIYCLGNDCSTQNVIKKFDEALSKLRVQDTPPSGGRGE